VHKPLTPRVVALRSLIAMYKGTCGFIDAITLAAPVLSVWFLVEQSVGRLVPKSKHYRLF